MVIAKPMNDSTENPPATEVLPERPSQPSMSERMSALAKRPRPPRGRSKLSEELSSEAPKWMKQLLDELDKLNRHPLLNKARRLLKAELQTAGLTPAGDLVEATARAKALCDLTDAALFNINGGPVNRHKRQLHRLTEQRDERLAAYLSLRQRIGLDQQPIVSSRDATPICLDDMGGIERSRRIAFMLQLGLNAAGFRPEPAAPVTIDQPAAPAPAKHTEQREPPARPPEVEQADIGMGHQQHVNRAEMGLGGSPLRLVTSRK